MEQVWVPDNYCEIELKSTLSEELDQYSYDATEKKRVRVFDNPISGTPATK